MQVKASEWLRLIAGNECTDFETRKKALNHIADEVGRMEDRAKPVARASPDGGRWERLLAAAKRAESLDHVGYLRPLLRDAFGVDC